MKRITNHKTIIFHCVYSVFVCVYVWEMHTHTETYTEDKHIMLLLCTIWNRHQYFSPTYFIM